MSATADVTIRAVTMSDLDDLVETMAQPKVIFGTMQLPYRNREKRGEWLGSALSDPDTHFLGAVVDGRMVGNLGLHTNSRNPRRKHMASLGMSVHDAFQGRGIGTALMHAAVDLADNWLNVRRLALEVYTDNEPAIALYNRFGFAIEGTLRDFSYRAGTYVDAYAMARIRES